MGNRLLEDKEGNLSSKRVAGYAGMIVAFILSLIFVFREFGPDITGLIYAWLGFASACLVGGVFERKQ